MVPDIIVGALALFVAVGILALLYILLAMIITLIRGELWFRRKWGHWSWRKH